MRHFIKNKKHFMEIYIIIIIDRNVELCTVIHVLNFVDVSRRHV